MLTFGIKYTAAVAVEKSRGTVVIDKKKIDERVYFGCVKRFDKRQGHCYIMYCSVCLQINITVQ